MEDLDKLTEALNKGHEHVSTLSVSIIKTM